MPIDGQSGRHFEELMLAELKQQDKENQKEIMDKNKEIKKSLKDAKEGFLPKKTAELYNKRFGRKNEKRAFFNLLIVFVLCFLLTFLIQPSIFFVSSGSDLYLSNYSLKGVKNVVVYKATDWLGGFFGDTPKPQFELSTFGSKQNLFITSDTTQVFIAFAERQMPAIGVITKQAPRINTSSENNNDTFYSGLKKKLNGGDTNG